MRVELDRDPMVLRALGVAQNGQVAISDVLDEQGKLIGYEVDPKIDLRGYAKMESDLAKPVVAVPATVADYQFAGQAYADGIIDFDAAKAWTGSGVVPKVLLDAVDALIPEQERHDRVVLFLMGTKEFPRHHDLTPILAATFGKDTPEKVDAFFVSAAAR